MKTRLWVAVACMLQAACALQPAPPLPMVSRVCLTAPQETPFEVEYLRKKVKENLAEYGFTLAEDQCEAQVVYQPMGSFQGERAALHLLWVSRSGYWSQEGMVTISRPGEKPDLEDQSVSLRGYGTKQALLVDLAGELTGPLTWLYRPPGKTK